MIPASIIHMQRGKRNSRNHQTHGSRKYGRSRTQKYIAQRGGPRPAAGSVARFEKRCAMPRIDVSAIHCDDKGTR